MRRNIEYYENLHQPPPGGPLMTNHLHDLNIQLELLKRKREIIQQEQEILNRFTTKRQYDYAHSSNTYDQQESNNQFNTSNYSQRYDDPSNSFNFPRPPPPVKRQTPNQYWQPPPRPERFIAPLNTNPWQTANVPQQTRFPIRKNFPPPLGNFSIGHIRPLMSIRPGISQRIQKNIPNQRNDFKPTKVTKSKVQPTLSKITPAVPEVETKKLVSNVIDTVSKKAESKNILRVDKAPSLQVNGRLELGLGTIMKEIKAEHCTTPKDLEYFHAPFVQRLLKHIIRTRIRSVMIDQVVGNYIDVVTNYRKKFPKETDIDLVNVAKDAQSVTTKSVGVAQLIESDDLQEFYNRNILKALVTKMDEMFLNLEKLYFKKDKDLHDYVNNMPDPKNIKEDTKTSKERQALIKHHKTSKDKINLESVFGDGDAVEIINEKLIKVKLYKDFMDSLIEQRLPKILPKFKDALLSMILTDKEFLTTKTMITSLLKKKLTHYFVKDTKGQKSPSSDNTKAKSDKSATSASIKSTPGSESIPTAETTNEKSENVDSKTLPDSSAVKVSDTEAVLKDVSSNTSPATPNKVSMEQNKPGTPIVPKLDDLLYVKLISRPNLPARAVIYDFLNKFKPTSIKKHKSINNLLVIGFKNKEDYDKILTVNETVIGNTTIIIKASEQVNKSNQSMSQGESNDSMIKSANQSLSDDSLLGSELENQISNLLTSIRKANEGDECPDANISDEINKTSEATIKTEVDANTCSTESDNSVNASDIDSKENLDTAKTDENINMSVKNEQQTKPQLDVKNEEVSKEITIIADKVDTVEITDSGNVRNVKGSDLEPITENSEDKKNDVEICNLADNPAVDKLKDTLKESGRATPTRSSSRLANSTPSIIRTRRASRLTQNN